ncbi:beta-glucosidase [Aureibaculum algae]|uniref:Beta-glucosidase n=1 Tax=Aureibaculum algae TaxID=2584122 RepID=A0A5B7TZV9_9FLAO|nr:glycoside hydrolase family 3 C-terminal domain-containing protein [Aureibaculum algae]QCX40317.1 beta-glucosidase [Aureibaculum algae]
MTICVVGLSADREGEEVDAIAAENVGDKVDLKLPENQINYVKEIAAKKKGPLVLVIASGSPVSLEGIEEHCDAILQIWYPGEQGGTAVADILFGDISPSGHLPITFPKNVNQLPPYEDYSMKERTYKYMTKEPMYPFGFGLTYSKTEIVHLKLNAERLKPKETLTATVTVKNTGNYAIDNVIQLYISPINTADGVPFNSLKAFKRVSLQKGETKNIFFSLMPEDLKMINQKGEKVWRKGAYKIIVGNASPGKLAIELGAAIPQEKTIQLK